MKHLSRFQRVLCCIIITILVHLTLEELCGPFLKQLSPWMQKKPSYAGEAASGGGLKSHPTTLRHVGGRIGPEPLNHNSSNWVSAAHFNLAKECLRFFKSPYGLLWLLQAPVITSWFRPATYITHNRHWVLLLSFFTAQIPVSNQWSYRLSTEKGVVEGWLLN